MIPQEALSWRTPATGLWGLKSEQGNRVEKKGESMGRSSYSSVVLIPDRAIGHHVDSSAPSSRVEQMELKRPLAFGSWQESILLIQTL